MTRVGGGATQAAIPGAAKALGCGTNGVLARTADSGTQVTSSGQKNLPLRAAQGQDDGSPAAASAAASDDATRLRQAARQLTGIFAQQLFKAMRETVPQDEGVVSGGSGEEMFTGMLDEHVAGVAPGRTPGAGTPAAGDDDGPGPAWTRALADAVFRHLRHGADPAAPAPEAAPPVTPAPRGASIQRLAPARPLDARSTPAVRPLPDRR